LYHYIVVMTGIAIGIDFSTLIFVFKNGVLDTITVKMHNMPGTRHTLHIGTFFI